MTDQTPKRRPKAPNLVQITAITDITPELRRITFSSPALHDYPAQCPAAHLKIFLAHQGQDKPDLPTLTEKGPVWTEGKIKPIVRSYTARYIRPELGEIDIEFILHGDEGPASQFAQRAKIGQYIGITYPGGPCLLSRYRHYYLVGDNTALPAIASLLETMPEQSAGHVFILLNEESGKLELTKPENVQIHWFIGESEFQTERLIAEFKKHTLPKDDVYFWLAGENNLVVKLRNYLRKECDYSKEYLYAVPYWRKGSNEEQYHRQRHVVMDEE